MSDTIGTAILAARRSGMHVCGSRLERNIRGCLRARNDVLPKDRFYLLAKEKEGWRVINQVAASRLETLRETDGRKDSDQ